MTITELARATRNAVDAAEGNPWILLASVDSLVAQSGLSKSAVGDAMWLAASRLEPVE